MRIDIVKIPIKIQRHFPRCVTILWLICSSIIYVVQTRFFEKCFTRNWNHLILPFIIKLYATILQLSCSHRRHGVVFGDADAAYEEVAWGAAGLEGEGAGVDDGEAAVFGELRAVAEAPDAVDSVGEVLGAFEGHVLLEPEAGVGEEEGGLLGAPLAEDLLCLLDDAVEAVCVFLGDPVHLGVEFDGLVDVALVVCVFLDLGALVVGRGDERDVAVEVVGVLDGPDKLQKLVLEVDASGGRHHKVVLH